MKDAATLEKEWKTDPRWKGIVRNYRGEDVVRLRGTVKVEYSLARAGADRLWKLIHREPFLAALGAVTGNQAVQMVKAGLRAIYVSGWQVAADANGAGQTYPDQSLYPADSVPQLVRRINNALLRADQIAHLQGKGDTHWMVPIVADAEAGFGGALNALEIMKAMIEAGAAAVHFEDQLSSAKKCGHLGGKVLVPTAEFVQKLIAVRFASDLLGVPTIIIARTDAERGHLITTDNDPRDQQFLTKERTEEGFFRMRGGISTAIARALAYAPYADMLWCETSEPNLEEARRFAEGLHAQFPGKPLAYNCSPSFNWKLKLDALTLTKFQRELAAMGYKFQFVTLAGFHTLNYSIFRMARAYKTHGMAAYAEMQASEFKIEKEGYEAIKHQQFVGTGYFDEIAQVISSGTASTLALTGSTEQEQFEVKSPANSAGRREGPLSRRPPRPRPGR